jgi:hypothetical protein
MLTDLQPLAEGNRFQRAYARFAAPYYERMPLEARADAELLDRFLYSRRGLGFWIGLLCAVAGSTVGLHGAGLPWWLAMSVSLLVWLALPLIGLSAWLMPNSWMDRNALKKYLLGSAFGVLGALVGFTIGHVAKHGSLDLGELVNSLGRNAGVLMTAALAVLLGFGFFVWGIARVRRGILQQELQRTTLAREAAEARLRLLQAQIQPHFIFNTLSALQHWVDTSDARAPGLLRSLTAFLRGSTELLTRESTTFGDEAQLVERYLEIQHARLGDRLQYSVQVAHGLARQPLPPGLLLTLIENAVEHGIAPTLGGGRVSLSSAVEGQVSVIRIDDNGVGLAPGWQEGIGLANCRARLTHRFGKAASLQFEALNPGTRARIAIEETA